jgi:hypothetical protein
MRAATLLKPQNIALGYGLFCVLNWAATYSAARSGSPLLLGSARLLSINESLRPFNLLAHIVDPLAAAQRSGNAPASVPAAPGAAFLPAPAPIVTQQDSGDTTYFGP